MQGGTPYCEKSLKSALAYRLTPLSYKLAVSSKVAFSCPVKSAPGYKRLSLAPAISLPLPPPIDFSLTLGYNSYMADNQPPDNSRDPDSDNSQSDFGGDSDDQPSILFAMPIRGMGIVLPEPLTLKAYDSKINYFWPHSTYNIPDALTNKKLFSGLNAAKNNTSKGKPSKDVDLQSPIADTPTGVIHNQRACTWADRIISSLTDRINANAEIYEVYYDNNGATDREEWIAIDRELSGGDVVEVESDIDFFDPLDSPFN